MTEPVNPAAASMKAETLQKQRHVLVVEASLSVRMALRGQLHKGGFLVTACETKAAASLALRGRRFDLAILDGLLPDGTGIDLLLELRALHGPSAHVPVILLSAEAEVGHRLRGFHVSPDVYIGKPYDPDYLLLCAQRLTEPADEAPESSAAVGAKKILIADDSASYRRRLGDALRAEGHDVILAASGEEALSFLELDKVDIVVLDAKMPNVSGIEVCRRLRASVQSRRTHVIAMVGSAEDRLTAARLKDAGANEILVRSPEIPSMCSGILAILRERSSAPSSRPASVRGGAPLDSSADTEGPSSRRPERVSYPTPEPSSERPPPASRDIFESLSRARKRFEMLAARERKGRPGSSG